MIQVSDNGVMCGETPASLRPCHPVLLIVTGHNCGDCPLARLYYEIDKGIYGDDIEQYEKLLMQNEKRPENADNHQD